MQLILVLSRIHTRASFISYSLYGKDIPNFVSCIPRLFADDTYLLVSIPSQTVLKNECNKEMNKLLIRFNANELQILKNLQ